MSSSEGTINFSPIYGISSSDPLCYLLEIDGYKILLDCGWSYTLNSNILLPLKSIISTIDIILITHSNIKNIGALPYAISKYGLSCPIYATIPTCLMGKITLLDLYKQNSLKYKFNEFSIQDIENVYSLMKQVKYGQDIQLTGKGNGISIMPCQAGHLLGSAFWKISKLNEDIIYAVDFHHSRERHLDATVLIDYPRPTVLITDANNIHIVSDKRKTRDNLLISQIENILRASGTVLLPTDSSGRILELLSMLHSYWDAKKLHDFYPLVMVSPMCNAMLANASTLIEWASEACRKQFDENRDNPFAFSRLKKFTTTTDFFNFYGTGRPMVILAPGEDMEESFARDIWKKICFNKNVFVLFIVYYNIFSHL